VGFVGLIESVKDTVVRACPGLEFRKKGELGKEVMCRPLRCSSETEVHATEKRWCRSW